jgi:probable rRNA maturation factor
MRVRIRSEHKSGAHSVRVLRAAAREFLAALKLRGELSVVVTTDKAIRVLNRDWRAKDKPTDVLSFPQDPGPGPSAQSPEPTIGDVVISLDTARRQAREGGWPLSVELRRLLAHGLLHCLGHDHEQPAEARRMARAELELLGSEGMVGAAFSQGGERSRRAAPPRRPGA